MRRSGSFSLALPDDGRRAGHQQDTRTTNTVPSVVGSGAGEVGPPEVDELHVFHPLHPLTGVCACFRRRLLLLTRARLLFRGEVDEIAEVGALPGTHPPDQLGSVGRPDGAGLRLFPLGLVVLILEASLDDLDETGVV